MTTITSAEIATVMTTITGAEIAAFVMTTMIAVADAITIDHPA